MRLHSVHVAYNHNDTCCTSSACMVTAIQESLGIAASVISSQHLLV